MKIRTAIVVGASSGIGAGLVSALAARGTTVAAIARRKSSLQALADSCGGRSNQAQGQASVIVREHDVLDLDDAPIAFDEVVEALGGSVDLVIYSAGVMPEVEEGEYNTAKDRNIVEVNLTGAIAWLNLAAAHMESRGAGTLVGISSVAGDRGRRGNPVYTAAKAGLTTYLEALRNRMSRYGVHVVTVKPGPVETDMTRGTAQPLMIPVDRCVRGILAAVDRGCPMTTYIPGVWRSIMTIIRLVPSAVFRRTNI
jgi:short-subunit dehydrogenase